MKKEGVIVLVLLIVGGAFILFTQYDKITGFITVFPCASNSDCSAGQTCDLYFNVGECATPTNPNYQFCSDSDGGYNQNVKGTVSWKNKSGTIKTTDDLCIGSNILMEAVCDYNGFAYNGKTYNCPGGCNNGVCLVNCTSSSDCSAGQTCDLYFNVGKCATPTNPNYQFCSDSDNGYTPNTKGTVTYKNANGVVSSATDLCLGDNMVMEAVCDYNGFAYNGKTYTCAEGCSEGACVTNCSSNSDCSVGQTCDLYFNVGKCGTPTNPNYQFCTDSDNGYVPNTKGTVTYKNANGVVSSATDLCLGDNMVMEAVCDYNGFAYNGKTHTCANGCADGACVINCSSTSDCSVGQTCDLYFDVGKCSVPTNPNYQFCSDSDNGYTPNTKGTVTYKNADGVINIASDLCLDEDFVMEAVCDHNGYAYNGKTYECKYGCDDGVCKSKVVSQNQTTSTSSSNVNTSTYNYNSNVGNMNTNLSIENETENDFCPGCKLGSKCYPFEYRLGENFCADSGQFESQLELDSSCNNDFECIDNSCVSGKCANPSFLDMVLFLLKRLFGFG